MRPLGRLDERATFIKEKPMSSTPRKVHALSRGLFVLLLLAACTSVGWAQGTVSNGVVWLSWAPSSRHGIVFTDVGDAIEPGAFTFKASDLWKVEFRDPNGPTVTTLGPKDLSFTGLIGQISPSQMAVSWSQCTSPLLPPGVSFNVTMSIDAPPGSQTVTLGINIQANTASAVSLYAVSFPNFEFEERGASPAHQVLCYPHSGGWLFPDPMHNPTIPVDGEAENGLVHPGNLSMQWFSYYDQSESNPAQLYFGTRDTCGWRKLNVVHRLTGTTGPDAMRYRVRSQPENNLAATPSASFSGFPGVIGVLHGTMFDAARLYRSWAIQQPWCSKGPVRTSTDFSPLIKNAKMFASVASDHCASAPPGSQCGNPLIPPLDPSTYQYWDDDLAEKKSYFGASSIPTHPYMWDDKGMDAFWGSWFPAKPDFVNAIPSYQALGDPFAPYFLNNAYTVNATGYANSLGLACAGGTSAHAWAVLKEDGTPWDDTYTTCIGNVGCSTPTQSVQVTTFPLDLATCFAYEYTLSVAQTLAGLGARGIYLDTYSNSDVAVSYNPVASVSPPATKPVGGGCSQGAAKVQLVENLRTAMRVGSGITDFYTISEGQCETMVGAFELVYGNFVGTGVDVNGNPRLRLAPLFDTVYRDYQFTSTVGPIDVHSGQVNPALVPSILIGRQSYAGFLFSGRLPHAGTVLTQPSMLSDAAQAPAYGQYVDMIQNFMGVLKHNQARDYFVFGERMRDPPTTAKTAALPGAGSPGVQGFWYLPYVGNQPLCYAAVFKRPDLNGFAVLFLNWTDTGDAIPNLAAGAVPGPQAFQYTVNPTDYGLPTGQYKRTEIVASGLNPITFHNLNGPTTFNVTVPARSARLFIYKKN
jgi:hypothetical protein